MKRLIHTIETNDFTPDEVRALHKTRQNTPADYKLLVDDPALSDNQKERAGLLDVGFRAYCELLQPQQAIAWYEAHRDAKLPTTDYQRILYESLVAVCRDDLKQVHATLQQPDLQMVLACCLRSDKKSIAQVFARVPSMARSRLPRLTLVALALTPELLGMMYEYRMLSGSIANDILDLMDRLSLAKPLLHKALRNEALTKETLDRIRRYAAFMEYADLEHQARSCVPCQIDTIAIQ